jgi:hypothetical protein
VKHLAVFLSGVMRRIKSIRPGMWLLPVCTFAALYLYRPFVLGFYSDDWGDIFGTSRQGGPFSLERFLWRWKTFARPLMNIETYLGSSALGTSSIAWHFLMIILIAITCRLLFRFLLALGARPTAATIASTFWLAFPWTLGYRAWPICSAILFSTIFFLAGSLALLKQRLWPATAWYAASMLFYEAFYFQFVVILVIMAYSSGTRRWTLRRATPVLFALQILVVILNRLAAAYAPGLAKSFASDWYFQFAWFLPRFPMTLSQGIAGGRTLALITVEVALLFAFVCAFRTQEPSRRVKLAAAALGFVISFLLLTATGYQVQALSTGSRSFVCLDIWMVVFLALPWERPVRARRMRWALGVGVTAVFIVLAVSTVVRTTTWQQVWNNEQTVLKAVPLEAVSATGDDAVIVALGLPTADGYPPFAAAYIMTNAVSAGIPGNDVQRTFYPASATSNLTWDGEWLLKKGVQVEAAPELWLWRWPSNTLEPVTSTGKLQ